MITLPVPPSRTTTEYIRDSIKMNMDPGAVALWVHLATPSMKNLLGEDVVAEQDGYESMAFGFLMGMAWSVIMMRRAGLIE